MEKDDFKADLFFFLSTKRVLGGYRGEEILLSNLKKINI
jgi:hypothetical protein